MTRPLASVIPTDPLRMSATAAWNSKEQGLQRDPDYDIVPEIAFFDADDRLIATVFPTHVNRDHGLALASIIGPIVKATTIVGSFDTHLATGENAVRNPVTGKPWEPGEMQQACDVDGACAVGVIRDAITTLAVREDKVSQIIRTYEVDHATGVIAWDEEQTLKDVDGQMTGLVVDGLRGGLAEMPAHLAEGFDDVERNALGLMLGMVIVGGSAFVNARSEAERDRYAELMSETAIRDLAAGIDPLQLTLMRLKYGIDDLGEMVYQTVVPDQPVETVDTGSLT